MLLLFCFLVLVGLLTACGGDSGTAGDAMDEAGDAVDSAMDEAGDAVDSAMDEAGDAVDSAMEGGAEMIDKIKAELAEKESELEKITEEMKNLSPTDLAGEKANELKAKSEALGDEIAALKEKLASLVE
jgi:DNA repair exonuclease SbcCD ATPase subunit